MSMIKKAIEHLLTLIKVLHGWRKGTFEAKI